MSAIDSVTQKIARDIEKESIRQKRVRPAVYIPIERQKQKGNERER